MYIVDDNAGKGCDTNDVVKKLPVHKWKDYVKNNESLIDIVIFKMVITEGWDIPRACMLYQVRDSQSKQMDEQVVGRVRRNPILLNWEDYDEDSHKIALISWVWGILDGSLRKFKQVSLIDKRNISVRTTKLNSILQKSTFILKDFLRLKNRSNNNISIFDLYRKWSDVSQETQDLCWKNINSFQDWSDFSIYLEEIETENNSYMADYENSMVEDENSSFPNTSYFEITDKTTEISNWSWKLNDPNDDEYHFDSSAEKDFAKILKKINTFFWGKNYYPNSNIKFEYILNNRHKSYPDFILKDKSDKVHIIEVKSINEGQTTFDPEEYLKKIEALKKMFLHASKITKQAFYLPIKSENDWIINKYDNGFHTILNLQMFLESFPK
jgi:type III restriction enzyme